MGYRTEIVENDDYERFGHTLNIIHNGHLVGSYYDHGEPEDNSFIRDYWWVPEEIKKAYEAGLKDGKNLTRKYVNGLCK